MEAGETPADAAVREACEEWGSTWRSYARRRGSSSGPASSTTLRSASWEDDSAPTGPEFTGAYPPERGHYEPVWLNLAEAAAVEVRPAPLMARRLAEGFGFLYRDGVIELSDPPS